MNEQEERQRKCECKKAIENAGIKRWRCGHNVSKSSHVHRQVKRSANESYWTCENAINTKSMPFTLYGVFYLTTFHYFHGYKFYLYIAHFFAE